MIDLHCHILPALDDGALDLDDSVAMARQAEADGIRTICATPHVRHDHDVLIAELPARVEELNAELRRRGVGVDIARGAEVAETAVRGLTPDELRGVTLGGGGRWVLVEPAPGPIGPSLRETIDYLESLGLRAVVAHPERHPGEALVERIADPADGRSFTVAATPKGRALLNKLRTRKNAYLARRLRRLDQADLAALERASEILEQLLEGERR